VSWRPGRALGEESGRRVAGGGGRGAGVGAWRSRPRVPSPGSRCLLPSAWHPGIGRPGTGSGTRGAGPGSGSG